MTAGRVCLGLCKVVMPRCAGAGTSGILNPTPAASSAQSAYVGGAPAGTQLGGLDLVAILQNAGVHPMPQPQPQPQSGVKQEPQPSLQVSTSFLSS